MNRILIEKLCEVCPSKLVLRSSKSAVERVVGQSQIMYYVYLLRSINNPSKTYIGYTANLKQRLETHNSGGSVHTQPDRPWKLVMFLAFDSEQKAMEFEKYIKVGSGNAFAKKRLW